jgi:CrcB protein
MSIAVWIGVACLGGCGALARFLLDGAIGSRLGGEFPWGTFAINVSGSFVLGLLVGAAVAGNALVLAGTATIGSYTTFSTWMLETQRLLEEGSDRAAALNLGLSVVLGVSAIGLGWWLGSLA